jgi:6-phosphogluconolactonase (cycloisomerase 2 family)
MVSEQAQISVANGVFSFASAFTRRGYLLVVEAFGKGPVLESTGAVSSYAIDADGCLQVISGSVDSRHMESCWIAVAEPYAYVTNFGSHVITGYRIGMDGRLERLNEDGVTARTGEDSHPLDVTASPDGQYLYALLPGRREVGAWRIQPDGGLKSLGAVKGDWPVYMQGIVAR